MALSTSYRHDHVQDVAASEWNINHNLNTLSPVVDCQININGEVQKILPVSVEVVDSMNVKVTWSSDRTGTAALR